MKLPPELEDRYVKEVLYNWALENLPNEEWKPIKDFENYEVSNYGRIKSLGRWVIGLKGQRVKRPEIIMKLTFSKFANNYLNRDFYNVHCCLASEGKKYRKSVPRLVYYHFVEKFDLEDRSLVISYKDDNRLHIHSRNLEKLSVSQAHFKRFRTDRAKNHISDYQQAVSQYTVDGDFVADFDSINEAKNILGIGCRNIFTVVNREGLTAGGFRWFLKGYTPSEEDFILPPAKEISDRLLNKALWKKLGKPEIDQNNPPACMNLSLKDLPGEEWKPLPGFEKQFSISNKGRIKRLNTWTDNKIRTFLNEHITSLSMSRLKDTDTYYIYALLNHNGKRPRITIARMLYYCFVETFDLNNKSLAVVNKNKPLWDMDLSKLFLYHLRQLIKESKALAPIKIRTILNSKKNFNDLLWEKFGKPDIDKNSPPAILDLSLKNLPGEEWKPLPGFEGKYVISNKGRVKRLSGWGVGTHFYGEEQIVSINIMKESGYSYLIFRVHKKESRNVNILPRLLYYCFVQEFDLNNKALVVANENEPIWDMDLSKLSLHSAGSLRK